MSDCRVTLRVLVALLAWACIGTVQADCQWTSNGRSLDCYPSMFSTGCIGLKNKSGEDIQFLSTCEINSRRVLRAGQRRHADYTSSCYIYDCRKRVENSWNHVNGRVKCRKVLSLYDNRSHGGGCGCKGFSCLPSQ